MRMIWSCFGLNTNGTTTMDVKTILCKVKEGCHCNSGCASQAKLKLIFGQLVIILESYIFDAMMDLVVDNVQGMTKADALRESLERQHEIHNCLTLKIKNRVHCDGGNILEKEKGG